MINFINIEVIVEAIKLEICPWIYLTFNLKMLCFENEPVKLLCLQDNLILANSTVNILNTDTNFSPLLGGSGDKESDCILKELVLTLCL